MPYIIENANILKGNHIERKSLLIRNNRIDDIKDSLRNYHYFKMNAEQYIMSPTYVLLDTHAPLIDSYKLFKTYITKEFILKGCTTLVTYANVTFEGEIVAKVKELKTALLSCPVDFLIGVRLPMRQITSSVIRKCKKEKIPAIFIEIQDIADFEKIAWSWIREALFPHNCPLVPIVSEALKKEEKSVLAKWKETMEKEKIPFIHEVLSENKPLSNIVLNKIGLLPLKSCFRHGAEISYNLYLKSREIKNVDEKDLFLYHRDRLIVTVHKGNVIRAGNEVLFKPGNGEYVKVKTPSYFSFS